MEFSSQRREMLLFLNTNMAAVTSRAKQQYVSKVNCDNFFYIIPTFRSFVIIIKYNLPVTVFIPGHQIKMLLDFIIRMQFTCLVYSRSRWFSGYLR